MEAGAGVGVPDAALLAPLTEEAFVHNLQVRFARDVVYTYVGGCVVCVNPCRALPLYSAELARAYAARPPHRLPPHVYGVAAAAVARVRDRREPQCIVVTGESGAGKTEAARLCLQCALVAAPAPAPALAAPLAAAGTLLEAFGNAATQRNHNASRFERAYSPPRGERNFHVLYQLLAGAEGPLLKRLKLQRSWQQYRILGGGEAGEAAPGGAAAALRDTEHFAFTTAAMSALGLTDAESGAVLRALAFMLKLGNVRFEPHNNIDGSIGTRLQPLHELREACALVGVDAEALGEALTAPHLPAAEAGGGGAPGEPGEAGEADGGEYCGDAEWSRAALDRLLGALYSRLFTWLVRRAEVALCARARPRPPPPPPATLSLLDLYGFEALADNGLERLLINYAAERLQAAVAGGARREQEEYAREGLPWRALPSRDADLAADLLDAGPDSVLGALRVAAAHHQPDRELVARLQRRLHPRLRVHPPDRFTVVHFAGAVTYSARGMADKDRDQVCRACGGAVGGARDVLLAELFAAERGGAPPPSPRRPAARSSRQRALVAALVRRLPAGMPPRLVRCLRADAALRPHRFDAALLRHQIRTQGILEMAVLRRAGWCESVCARELVARYGVLALPPTAASASAAPEEPVRAARALLRALPIPGAEFAYGRTKVFIRSPRTVWELEALRAARVAVLVCSVQRAWRQHRARRQHAAARTVWRAWSAWRARRGSSVARAAAARRVWRWWCGAARRRYLEQLWARLGARHRSPACAAWPPLAPHPALLLGRTDALLRHVHHAWRCRLYRAAFDQTARNRMREKATASALFRGHKVTYAASVAHPFVGDYVRLRASGAWRRGAGAAAAADRYVVFADAAGKVARASGREARVLCVLSTAALLLLDAHSLRVRRRVPAHHVRALSLSPHADDVLVVHVLAAAPHHHHHMHAPLADAVDSPGCLFAGEGARRRRGDVVLRTVHVLELATKLFLVVQNAVGAPPLVNIATE